MSDGFSPEIAAIPTVYNGTEFRSRAEARWAIFFDVLGVPWEYEPRGYKLADGTNYLPDFWLPDQRVFWEVKGVRDTGHEKALALADVTLCAVFIAVSDPRPGHEAEVFYPDNGYDIAYQWCVCPKCGCPDPQFCGRAERNRCGCLDPNGPDTNTGNHPAVMEAYRAAMGHRFWDPS